MKVKAWEIILAVEEGTVSATEWQNDAIIYSAKEQLIPAGLICVK